MSPAEWTNILVQIVIAAAQLVIAAVSVYSAHLLWQRRDLLPDKAPSEPEPNEQLSQSAPTISTSEPDAGVAEDLLALLVDVVRQKDQERSRHFDEMPSIAARTPRRVLIPILGTAALSLLASMLFIAFFPSKIVTGVIVALALLATVVSIARAWRSAETSHQREMRQAWERVHQTEDELEGAIAAKLKDHRFEPEMALELHDALLTTKPRVWPPMVIIADRAIIGELVSRLTSKEVIS
jgi:hypothetical protein